MTGKILVSNFSWNHTTGLTYLKIKQLGTSTTTTKKDSRITLQGTKVNIMF